MNTNKYSKEKMRTIITIIVVITKAKDNDHNVIIIAITVPIMSISLIITSVMINNIANNTV